ncbi:unnamed protein product [Brassicogethes aeneus]|uniref:Uncharacterized protein n=1 Tax=Brassicogethes aeneus TaxID=1431903 RepID=A0A9P0BI18_BRAAE|nr:unnamed protein product [Brassicogethes aeneus]
MASAILDMAFGTEKNIIVLCLVGASKVGKTMFVHGIKKLLEQNYFIDTYIFKDGNNFDTIYHELKELLRHIRVTGDDFQTTCIIIDKNLPDPACRNNILVLASLYRAHTIGIFFEYDFSELLHRNAVNLDGKDSTHNQFVAHVLDTHPPSVAYSNELRMTVPWKFSIYPEFLKLISIIIGLKSVPDVPPGTKEVMNYISRTNLVYSNFEKEILPKMNVHLPSRLLEKGVPEPKPDVPNNLWSTLIRVGGGLSSFNFNYFNPTIVKDAQKPFSGGSFENTSVTGENKSSQESPFPMEFIYAYPISKLDTLTPLQKQIGILLDKEPNFLPNQPPASQGQHDNGFVAGESNFLQYPQTTSQGQHVQQNMWPQQGNIPPNLSQHVPYVYQPQGQHNYEPAPAQYTLPSQEQHDNGAVAREPNSLQYTPPPSQEQHDYNPAMGHYTFPYQGQFVYKLTSQAVAGQPNSLKYPPQATPPSQGQHVNKPTQAQANTLPQQENITPKHSPYLHQPHQYRVPSQGQHVYKPTSVEPENITPIMSQRLPYVRQFQNSPNGLTVIVKSPLTPPTGNQKPSKNDNLGNTTPKMSSNVHQPHHTPNGTTTIITKHCQSNGLAVHLNEQLMGLQVQPNAKRFIQNNTQQITQASTLIQVPTLYLGQPNQPLGAENPNQHSNPEPSTVQLPENRSPQANQGENAKYQQIPARVTSRNAFDRQKSPPPRPNVRSPTLHVLPLQKPGEQPPAGEQPPDQSSTENSPTLEPFVMGRVFYNSNFGANKYNNRGEGDN